MINVNEMILLYNLLKRLEAMIMNYPHLILLCITNPVLIIFHGFIINRFNIHSISIYRPQNSYKFKLTDF